MRLVFDSSHQRHPIPNRHHYHLNPLIIPQFPVEPPDCLGIRIGSVRVDYGAAPEGVVDGDEAARSHEGQAGFVVVSVVDLVGVDEAKS